MGENIRFITRLPANFKACGLLIREAVASGSWVDVGQLSHRTVKGKEVCAGYRLHGTRVDLYGRTYRALVVHSDAHDRRRQKRIDRTIEKDALAVKERAWNLSCKEFFCLPDAQAAAEALKGGDLHEVSCSLAVRPIYGKGRPSKSRVRPVKDIRFWIATKVEEKKEAIELLGVGGVRALHALGIHPSVLHLNEGHSAFAIVEMIRSVMEQSNLPFGEVVREIASMTVFTTHTPVAAGHDRFPASLVEEHLGKIREALRLSFDDFMGLGRVYPGDGGEQFCLTVLALKLSRYANGVSALHGAVSRRMWHPLFPSTAEENVPIGHITNGVHVQSWVSPQMHLLFDRNLGTDWPKRQRLPETWAGIEAVEDAELWETQQVLKARLINFIRNRLVQQARRRDEPDAAIERAMHALDLGALTIGFARRFATYKRAGLILQDLERLTDLVSATDRPIQIIFGGKAHPEDRMGKELIQGIVRWSKKEPFAGKIVFVEDYDMNVARQLVQGVDVWLNNPRRPQEASGTSGEKAVFNGTLNFSILDGWWAEAYDGRNGFAIGQGQVHASASVQDERDHKALLETLTQQVVPLYYQRDATGLPREWIARQKNAFRTLAWRFNADRMVMDYVQNSYLPAAGGVSCWMPRS